MRVAIFFVQLCLFLLKTGDDLHAVVPYHTYSYTYTLHYQKAAQAESAGTARINNTEPGKQHVFFISGDIEDENMNDFFSRKFKSPLRYYSAYPSGLDYTINIFKADPSCRGWSSYKYILQRVLRV